METDWSVEMGHADPVLEFPWHSDDPNVCYCDLKTDSQLATAIPEAVQHEPIRDFLVAVNEPASPFQTAKCDVWEENGSSGDYQCGAFCRACYVDVLFMDRRLQSGFEAHEALIKDLAKRVGLSAFDPGAAEFVVRRCFYHRDLPSVSAAEEAVNPEPGCYITCYIRGYGEDEESAYANWARTLAIVRDALLTSRVPGIFR